VNSASLLIPGSERAFSHGASAIASAEDGEYGDAADAHDRAAWAHRAAATKALKNNNVSGHDEHRQAMARHQGMARRYRKLADGLTGNSLRIGPAGGDPLPLTAPAVLNNYVPETVVMNAFDRPSFDAAPGTQIVGSGGLAAGGAFFLPERQSPPQKSKKKGQAGPDLGAPQLDLDDDQQIEPSLTEPFDGRGIARTKRRKGDKRAVTDSRGHPNSGTDSDLEDAAVQPRYREDVDSDNYMRLGLAHNQRYQELLSQGCLPPTGGGVMEVIRLERLAANPKLAR
jgi:hypothetical protein